MKSLLLKKHLLYLREKEEMFLKEILVDTSILLELIYTHLVILKMEVTTRVMILGENSLRSFYLEQLMIITIMRLKQEVTWDHTW